MQKEKTEDLKSTDFIPIFGFKNYVDRNIDKPTPDYFYKSKILSIYDSTILTLGSVIIGEGLLRFLSN